MKKLFSKMLIAAVLAVFALGATACGGSKKQTKSTPAPAASKTPQQQTKKVVLYQYRFNPNTLSISKGTKVVFTNKDPDTHNVNIPALNVDHTLKAGAKFSHTFSTTGEFAVSDRMSTNPMKMTIVVK